MKYLVEKCNLSVRDYAVLLARELQSKNPSKKYTVETEDISFPHGRIDHIERAVVYGDQILGFFGRRRLAILSQELLSDGRKHHVEVNTNPKIFSKESLDEIASRAR